MAIASGRAGMVLGWYGFYLTTFLSRLNLHELLELKIVVTSRVIPRRYPRQRCIRNCAIYSGVRSNFWVSFPKIFLGGGTCHRCCKLTATGTWPYHLATALTCTHTRTHARTHPRMRTHTHTHTHARMHGRTHARTHARTHTLSLSEFT